MRVGKESAVMIKTSNETLSWISGSDVREDELDIQRIVQFSKYGWKMEIEGKGRAKSDAKHLKPSSLILTGCQN